MFTGSTGRKETLFSLQFRYFVSKKSCLLLRNLLLRIRIRIFRRIQILIRPCRNKKHMVGSGRVDKNMYLVIFFKKSLLFCCNSSTKSGSGKSVCPSVRLFYLFCHLLKNSSGNPYLKICDLMQYFFADAPMKKKISKILCTRGYSTFWKPSTK